eukprot:616666-Pelagomonas_calceolata.AAC.1
MHTICCTCCTPVWAHPQLAEREQYSGQPHGLQGRQLSVQGSQDGCKPGSLGPRNEGCWAAAPVLLNHSCQHCASGARRVCTREVIKVAKHVFNWAAQ